jgi:hypothetical protein
MHFLHSSLFESEKQQQEIEMGRVMSPVIPVWSWVFAALMVSHLFDNWHVSALRVGKLGLHRPVSMGKLFHSFHRNQQLLMATVESSEQSFTVQSVVVDGFFSKAANFADPQTAGKLYEKVRQKLYARLHASILASACLLFCAARHFRHQDHHGRYNVCEKAVSHPAERIQVTCHRTLSH